MRRISRLDSSIVRLQSSTRSHSPFLCTACSRHTPSFSTSSRVAAQAKEPFTEKIRKKLWGTDSPPGQKDPYTAASALDQTKKSPEVASKASATSLSADHFDETYEPAESWEGLETVGVYQPPYEPFLTAFTPAVRVTDPYEVTALLHRAVVEVFALRRAGLPLSHLAEAGRGIDLTSEVDIVPLASGEGAEFRFLGDVSEESIVQSLMPSNPNPTESEQDLDADRSTEDPLVHETPVVDETATKENPTESEEDVAADRSTVDPLTDTTKHQAIDYQHQVSSWDPTWLSISLSDTDIKFAVFKRTIQLTGHLIPDAHLNSTNSINTLLHHLITPARPRKLIESLIQNEVLRTLPNVKLHASRVTPIDKERSVGRWKIIEKELLDRGLPVTGR